MEVEKFILDTDTGVDDAMAILQMIAAKKQGKADLLAITAVKGNCSAKDAVRNICRTLDTVGDHEVPVYYGAQEPLVVPYESDDHYHGNDGFNDVHFDTEPDLSRVKEELAWNVIIDLSKQYPNQITLIAIGPLTNVAVAMKMDPGLPSRLKEIFIMGGNFEGIGNVTAAAEFNFYADPEAANVVLRNTRCPTYIAAWELSFKYTHIQKQWRDEVLGNLTTPAANLINKLEQVWFDDWPWGDNWILCDQLAMTAALERKSIIRSAPQYATVELNGEATRGMMVVDQRVYNPRSASQIATVELKRDAPEPNVIIIQKLDEHVIRDQMYAAFNQ